MPLTRIAAVYGPQFRLDNADLRGWKKTLRDFHLGGVKFV